MTAGQELAQAMTQRLPERAGLWERGEASPKTRHEPGGKKRGTKYIQSPWGGALGSPPADRGGALGENRRSEPLAPSLCMAGFQGAECISHIPLKKIYLCTLAFSMASWLFGSEPVLAPQGFRGAAGEGVLRTEQ